MIDRMSRYIAGEASDGEESSEEDEPDQEDAGEDAAGEEAESRVCLVTGDYAMQNVALQMGLRLVAPDGKRIWQTRRWALRCSACFQICKVMSKAVQDAAVPRRSPCSAHLQICRLRVSIFT